MVRIVDPRTFVLIIAFNSVKRFLVRELPEVFYEAEVVGFVVGFVIKLEVRQNAVNERTFLPIF